MSSPSALLANLSIQHAPLIGYFVLIISLLTYLLPLFLHRPTPSSTLFFVLSISALFFTWKYMLLFFERSFIEAALNANIRPQFYSTEAWLTSTSLFYDAWSYVCSTPLRWWFSSQLCSFTAGPFTLFLARSSRKNKMLNSKVWAFMLLGQVVAISFAAGLWGVALCLNRDDKDASKKSKKEGVAPEDDRPSLSLTVSTLLSLLTVPFIPSSLLASPAHFLSLLLAMHILLIIPFIPLPSLPYTLPLQLPSYARLSFLHLLLSIYPRLHYITEFRPSLEQLTKTFYQHPAQTSISYDVLWVGVIVTVGILGDAWKNGRWGSLVAAGVCVGGMPLTGAAGGCAAWGVWRELARGQQKKALKVV